MADTTTEQCPICGHLTTGKKESHGILGAVAGGVAGGVAFGPAGALLGGILGGSAGHDSEYHFCCSKCGHSWSK